MRIARGMRMREAIVSGLRFGSLFGGDCERFGLELCGGVVESLRLTTDSG